MKLRITVDGKSYEVDVEVAEEARVGPAYAPYYAPRSTASVPSAPGGAGLAPAPAGPAAAAGEAKVCRSPLAGVVVRVNTHAGQHLQENDPLLVLEAMKMETNVNSPVSGTVKAVAVDIGDAVQAGQVLVEFE